MVNKCECGVSKTECPIHQLVENHIKHLDDKIGHIRLLQISTIGTVIAAGTAVGVVVS